MAEYLGAAIKRGDLPAKDVLLFDDSLEASNATPEELIELARQIGLNPPEGREAVELKLDPETLMAYHGDRRARSARGDNPGLADSLIRLARREEHGKLELDKLELVEAFAGMLVDELLATGRDDLEALAERRPIVGFVLKRLVLAINRPRPA
jgi:hypothetical protein